MTGLKSDELGGQIYDFMNFDNNPALFAGAGVGVRAGLPSWAQFLQHLAQTAKNYDLASAELIINRAKSGHYISAATVYKTCPQIPQGELYNQVAKPFINPPSWDKLKALVSLPFSAIVTTNYDRSIHNACASVIGKAPNTVELYDPTMRRAPFYTEFYIARIHGRAEVPESIVFANDDYNKVYADDAYSDFVRHCFTMYRCLFVGFSFLDPAIDNVLNIIEKRLAPDFPSLHLAILPSDVDYKLIDRLNRLNIKHLLFDVDKDYQILWDGVKFASQKYTTTQKVNKPEAVFQLESIKRFIGTSYLRIRHIDTLQPLRNIVIDGIILDFIDSSHDAGITVDLLSEKICGLLGLALAECNDIVSGSIKGLIDSGICKENNGKIYAVKKLNINLNREMKILNKGIVDRLFVREGLRKDLITIENIVPHCLEDIILSRGWDLGAQYAGAKGGELTNLYSTISMSVEKFASKLSENQREALTHACYDLFQNPDESESRVLSDLGRISFALQIVLNTPCASIAYKDVLPDIIYLDASFLMPALIEGHPYNLIYSASIERFVQATESVKMKVSIAVADEFLNEVISHKKLAINEVEALSLENIEDLSNHILYNQAENVNVFIAAFGNFLQVTNSKISFKNFLEQFAPYNNEIELSRYLTGRGISTPNLKPANINESDIYKKIYISLRDGYANDEKFKYTPKPDILIRHEALQLTRLQVDIEKGSKPLFVTSDTKLLKISNGPILGKSGSAIITNKGMIQLMDLLLGLNGNSAVTARLLWGSAINDETTLLRDYLINKALQQRDEIMAMTLNEVLNKIVPESMKEAKMARISLYPGGTIDDRLRRTRFLVHVEDRFYEQMSSVIKDKFPEEYDLPQILRKEFLENQISENDILLKKYLGTIKSIVDEKEIVRLEKEIQQIRNIIQEYQKILINLEQ